MESRRARADERGRARAGEGGGGRATFLASCERGDRVRPKRHSRNYWHLVILSRKMLRVAESPLLAGGERRLGLSEVAGLACAVTLPSLP